jgi:hypothetical protein
MMLSMKTLVRRNPVSVMRKEKPLPSLATCVALDLIGYASFAVPFFGELIDLVWAPISAVIYWRLFGFKKGFFGGWFSFVEELMPGLDLIPTFTITWFIQYAKRSRTANSISSTSPVRTIRL